MVLNPQNLTTSQEQPAAPLTGAELVRLTQAGASVRATTQQVAALAASTGGGSITRAQIPTVTISANTIIVTGYATDGDLGAGAIYTKFTGGTPPATEYLAIQDASGQWFNLVVPEGKVNVGWFGAVNDANGSTGVGTDNHDAFQKCIDFCTAAHPLPPLTPPGSTVTLYEMFIPAGGFRIGTGALRVGDVGRGHLFWSGAGVDTSFYKRSVIYFDHSDPYCITIDQMVTLANFSQVRDLGFAGINQSILQHCFNFQAGQQFVSGGMRNLSFSNFTGYCIFFTGNNAYWQCASFKDIFMSIVGGFIGADVALITGSISGTTLTVTAVESGVIRPQGVIEGSGLLRTSAIDGTPIDPNTYVTAQLTGTPGGVGTYTVSVSQTSISQPMRQNAMFAGGNVFLFENIDLENGVNQAFRQHAFFDFINMSIIIMDQVIYEGGASTPSIFRFGGNNFLMRNFYIEQNATPFADYFFEIVDTGASFYGELNSSAWENAPNISTIFWNRSRANKFILRNVVTAASHPTTDADVTVSPTGPGFVSNLWNRVIQDNSGKFLSFTPNVISNQRITDIKGAPNSGEPRARLYVSCVDDALYRKHGAWLDGDDAGGLVSLSAPGAANIGMFTDATYGRVFEIVGPANTLPDFRVLITIPTELVNSQLVYSMRYYFLISTATTTPQPFPLGPTLGVGQNEFLGTASYTAGEAVINSWGNAYGIFTPTAGGVHAVRLDSTLQGASPGVTDPTPKMRIAGFYIGTGTDIPFMLGGGPPDVPLTWQAAGPPTYGVYIKGDRVINNNPSPGQPTGWTCTTAGTIGSGCVFTPNAALSSLRTTANSIVTTGTYTVVDADDTITFNAAGTCTVTLPAPASYVGRWLHFLTVASQTVVSASSNVVPLTGGAAGTAILSAVPGRHAGLQSDGTNWRIMQGVT